MSDPALLLIVCQQPAASPELETLLGELQAAFQLDIYTARQRLLGSGLVQLVQGGRSRLEPMASLLRRYGYECWVVPPPQPACAPPRLRSLKVGAGHVDFLCEGDRLVRLERGVAVVGVLADLSGELAGKQIKRMLARNAYLGREQATVSDAAELRQAILKEQPVFDCYLLGDSGGISAAFRVLPGRFNPEGLGERASLGAVRNLEAVVALVEEYAGNFRLHSDFGLNPLPGCQPQPSREDPAAQQGNLEALTRYGCLVAGLAVAAVVAPVAERPAAAGELPATGLTTAGGGAGIDPVAEPLQDLAAAVEAATDEPIRPAAPGPVSLPPPPERAGKPFPWWRVWPFVMILLGSGLLGLIGKSGPIHEAFFWLLRAGAVPGLAAGVLCWGGFVCLRVRRCIEDTPTSRIRSAAMGLVELHGRAVRRYALVAPMTQSACAWYRLRRYRRDRNDNWQMTSQSDSSHVPFLLDDGTGQIVVDPYGATFQVQTQESGYPGERFLIGARDGGADEKWVEELILEGTTLYVLGYARPERTVGSGLRERTAELLRRVKLDPQARRRYDTNGDGRLDDDEWQAVRSEAERLAVTEQLRGKQPSAAGRVFLGRPPRGLPFLIAERQTGGQVASSYGQFGWVLLAMGLASFGLAVKMSVKFFHLL